MTKVKKLIAVCCMLVLLCLGLGIGVVVGKNIIANSVVYAAQDNTSPKYQTAPIEISAYKLQDNSGYNESEDKKVSGNDHPLKRNLIDLSIFTQSGISQATIDQTAVSGYKAYGINGDRVEVQLSYNFPNAQNLYQRKYLDRSVNAYKTEVYSISNDTYQNVGNLNNVGVVGTGALILQKKMDPNGNWTWQTKDGETKTNLHSVNFTDFIKLDKYCYGNKYPLYTPSGKDLSQGVFIKITFAYEIKITTTWNEKNSLGILKTKSETSYINMLETAEFCLFQNSVTVLFHNASTFGKVGEDNGSGALSLKDFETILDGDVTLNGFRLDTLGVESYDIKYRFNGGEEHKAGDGQFFLDHGRYDFTISRDIGPSIKHTIFVDRREINDAIVGYFGQSLFTPDSQRIYTTGDYPTYIAGKATWHLNATDGTVAPLVGKIYRIDKDGKVIKGSVNNITPFDGVNYKTEASQGTIDEVGTYKAEFWGNPKYLEGGDISGDLFHFTFTFEIVDKDTPTEPSINEAYLNGLLSFSDMQSKYYAVVMPTKGEGNAIFAFADYGGAYDFAYEIERSKVKVNQGKYEYNGKIYITQKAVLTAVDEIVKTQVVERYFDSTNPESYQTADIDDDKILEMNFTKDVVVFLNDDEQSYMQAGLPSLNGRKYRYVSPDTGDIQEGVMDFAFLKIADFESNTVKLTYKAKKDIVYEINYGVSVEYQLGLLNAPSGIYTVREENSNNSFSEYDVMYIRPGDMMGTATLSLFRGGKFIEKTFGRDNTVTESGLSGFILKSLSNELDAYSIVKIKHNNTTSIYTFDEVSDMWFSEGGVYDFTLADRLGNKVEFSLVISNPVGYADVYLQLEQEDEDITKHFHVFVGQEIQLPTPKLTSELYVFDGWLYNDELITDNLFVPTIGGTLYVWQQVTQKYTYLDFDADGGESVERMKVEIGEPVQLPSTSKDGWTFGGWEYVGTVYDGEFIPTSANPIFVAIWNYQITEISLYDGNLVQTIEAHVGEKVILPFPMRTGYTFFGWREEEDENQDKVYYGQITKVANVEYMRLDALWIRENSEDLEALSNGTGGRTMIHFVDGELLSNDSLQGVSGATVSLPKVTRAGFIFIGWIWKTTSTSGKIYSNSTMTIPAGAGNKMVLEALWVAKEITIAQSAKQEVATEKLSATTSSLSTSSQAAIGSLISMLGLIVVMCLVYIVRRKGRALSADLQTLAPICGRDAFADKQSVRQRRLRKYGSATLFTAFLLVVVITLLSAFGGWGNLGVFQKFNNEINVTPVQSETVESDVIGNTFELDNYSEESETKPSKEEVLNTLDSENEFTLDLNSEEKFLYSLIMLDYSSMGYIVFPANAILPDGEIVIGIGYTNFEKGIINNSNDDYKVCAGFVALPRQRIITEQDIEKEVLIKCLYEDSNGIELTSVLAYTHSYGPCHYVVDNKYIIFEVKETQVNYKISEIKESNFNEEYGYVYSYDENRIIFDSDLGKVIDIKATSLNTLLNPMIAQNEYSRYIVEQTANGFTVDTLNFVFISYEALEAYSLSEQDESLLGIDVQEFYDIEKTLGGNEYYTVDADGNLTKLEFPQKDEDKATWLDRLWGALAALGIVAVGVAIVAGLAISGVVTCGTTTAIAPYIMGAAIGAAVDVFMQTVFQGKKLDQINWLRVGIAAVSGVLSAIPGVGWFGAGLIQGVTGAAFTAVDGGRLEDVLESFAINFVEGIITYGLRKALEKIEFCFVAGTAVLMASGAVKAIENIRVGDMVKSYNTTTGKVESKRVLQTFENETDELVTISTSDGQQVTATPGHKFYANNDWVSAEDLRAGDVLVNVNGEKVIVEQVQHEILDSPVKVYNFEVADNHTYFVGNDNGIVVHNRACGYRQKLLEKDGIESKKGYDAHHQIPQQIEKDYNVSQFIDESDPLDINDPKYLEWVEEHLHRSKSKEYNDLWREKLNAVEGSLSKEIILEIWNSLKNFFKNGGKL